MDNSNSTLAKNTIVLYLRMIFQMGVFLYTSRIVIGMLGVQDYGIYDVVAGIVVMLSFLNNSLTTCTQRYITVALGKGEQEHLNAVYSASIQIHALMAALVFLLGETVGLWYVLNCLVFPASKLWDVVVCYQCSLLMGLLLIMSIPYNATIIAHERMTAFAGITIMDVVLKLAVALMLCCFATTSRLIPYALMMLCVAIITRLSYSIYCHFAFPALRFRLCRDKRLIREMLGFAGWSTFGNTAIACNTQGLNLVLNYVGGPAVNAARGVAFQVQMAVTQFVASFQTAINPRITKSHAEGCLSLTHELVLRASRLSYMLCLIITVPLLLAAPWVLQLWLGVVPDHAASFMRIMILVSMVDAIANPMMVAVAATGRIKAYHTCIGTILLLTLPIALLCVGPLHLPYETVFLVLLLTNIIAQLVRLFFCKKLLGMEVMSFVRLVLTRVVSVSVLVTAFAFVLHGFIQSIAGAIIACIAVEAGLLPAIFFLGLQGDERRFIIERLKVKG